MKMKIFGLHKKMLATLYDISIATINEHIKNIFQDNELQEKATIRNFLIVQKEGNRNVSRRLGKEIEWVFNAMG